MWYSLGVQREGKHPLSIGKGYCSSYSSWWRSQIENVIILINFISWIHLFLIYKHQFQSRPPAFMHRVVVSSCWGTRLQRMLLFLMGRTPEDLGSWKILVVAVEISPLLTPSHHFQEFTNLLRIIRAWCNQLWSISSKYTTGRPVLLQHPATHRTER